MREAPEQSERKNSILKSNLKKKRGSKKNKLESESELSCITSDLDRSSYYKAGKVRALQGNKPPHPPSGYCIFTSERRPELRELKPSATKVVLKNIMNREWRKVNQEPYKLEAKKRYREFRVLLELWQEAEAQKKNKALQSSPECREREDYPFGEAQSGTVSPWPIGSPPAEQGNASKVAALACSARHRQSQPMSGDPQIKSKERSEINQNGRPRRKKKPNFLFDSDFVTGCRGVAETGKKLRTLKVPRKDSGVARERIYEAKLSHPPLFRIINTAPHLNQNYKKGRTSPPPELAKVKVILKQEDPLVRTLRNLSGNSRLPMMGIPPCRLIIQESGKKDQLSQSAQEAEINHLASILFGNLSKAKKPQQQEKSCTTKDEEGSS